MLDGIIDAHKINALTKAVVFGSPERLYGIYSMCLENMIDVNAVACGTKNNILENYVTEAEYLSETDFEKIQEITKKYDTNILIGSSEGKWIEEKEDISLLRTGFPIHDRLGGQRILHIGYEGTLNLVEGIANINMKRVEEGHRQNNYENYYEKELVF